MKGIVFFVLSLALALPALAAQGVVTITEEGDYRTIRSNGLPGHATGDFPNAHNPNTISEQDTVYRVAIHPKLAGHDTPLGRNTFGVAVNGVPFDPGTAENWENNPRSGWNYEALSGHMDLGTDQNNAHVQPTGAYHYHGVPNDLIAELGGADTIYPLQIGYAADGFPIFYEKGVTSSYRIKSGTRPDGPKGRYDGTFVQDYEYVADLGNLDECNGMITETEEFAHGIYGYYVTNSYPFIPRCFKGTPDASFAKRPPPPHR